MEMGFVVAGVPRRSARRGRVDMVLSVERVHRMRDSAEKIRCPFLRRRSGDAVDFMVQVATWLSARHKRLDYRRQVASTAGKMRFRSVEEVCGILRDDFEKRKYYVTGALTKEIYEDSCYFNGPDPDLPVSDLKKYVDACAHLFDRRMSKCDLLRIEVLDSERIVAEWRLEAVLQLPWRPPIKAFLGRTTFHINDEGLVHRHIEEWSISALDAFVSTLVLRSFGAPPAPTARELLARGREEPFF